mmetsp:Transcript_2889/g.4287  ORF Transcript_2889/g.4287 Transcript_2889/m.4287 type:complete len:511 (-) Transcript_2889:202-1734(-)
MSKSSAVGPLQDLLDSVLGRLEALEAAAGIEALGTASGVKAKPSKSHASTAVVPPSDVPDDSPSVKAYDEHMKNDVAPLMKSCAALELEAVGNHLKSAWDGIRFIIVLATRSKLPQEDLPTALSPHLNPIKVALEGIQKLRLDRKFDWHIKAVLELATCLSWILIKPPPQTPVAFCKEAIASSIFWSNKIRKEFKGKDEKQISFCDTLKAAGDGLVAYVTEYHKTGLTFNPKGLSMAEAAVILQDRASELCPSTPKKNVGEGPPSPRHRKGSISGGAGGMSSLMSELHNKQTADGSSAATGLKKVTREQQTWRKEFKGENASNVPTMPKLGQSANVKSATGKKPKKAGLPICEYQERGHKWVVEHQTSDAGVLTIEISDPKQQVYMFNCEDVTVQVKGEKLKSIIMDKCRRVNVVFNSCISSCEMVNSQKIQCQTTGVCPTFSIDKTVGCLIYLSADSRNVTSFVTSQSSEMNVSYPDDNGVYKEVPIPEQFVHKVGETSLTSEVSDLYH